MDIHRMLEIIIATVLLVAGVHDVSAILDITITASVGKRIALSCRVPYGTQDTLVKWYMGNKLLSVGTNVYYYVSRLEIMKPAPNEFNLIINSVVRSDDEIFTCNSYKDTFSKIKLEVEWRPEFEESMTSPYHVTMGEGTEGQLKCTAEGKPNPTITWYRRPQRELSPFQEIGVTGHTLTMQKVTRYVNDVFMCNASNAQGHVIREMNVTVNFPPEVDILEEDIYAHIGEQILATCLIQGSPLKDFYWKFQNQKIESTWKYMEDPPKDIAFAPKTPIVKIVHMTLPNVNDPNNRNIWVHVEHEVGYPAYLLTLMTRPGRLGLYDFGTYTCHAEGRTEEVDDVIHIMQKRKIKKPPRHD